MKKQNTVTTKEDLRQRLEAGEDERTEFKASLRWNQFSEQPDADDIKTLSSKRRTRDGFELHFWKLIAGTIGDAATAYLAVTLHEIDGQDICQVRVEPSNDPIYVKESQDQETFYLRIGNSTRPLPLSEVVK